MALNSRGKAVLRVGVVIQDFPSLFHLLVQLSHAGRAADSLLCPPTSRGFSCLNGAWPATPRQVRGSHGPALVPQRGVAAGRLFHGTLEGVDDLRAVREVHGALPASRRAAKPPRVCGGLRYHTAKAHSEQLGQNHTPSVYAQDHLYSMCIHVGSCPPPPDCQGTAHAKLSAQNLE